MVKRSNWDYLFLKHISLYLKSYGDFKDRWNSENDNETSMWVIKNEFKYSIDSWEIDNSKCDNEFRECISRKVNDWE